MNMDKRLKMQVEVAVIREKVDVGDVEIEESNVELVQKILPRS
jgi:hypothetical protein